MAEERVLSEVEKLRKEIELLKAKIESDWQRYMATITERDRWRHKAESMQVEFDKRSRR